MSVSLFRIVLYDYKVDFNAGIKLSPKKKLSKKLSLFGRLKKKYSHYIRHKKYIKSKIKP